MRTFKQFFNESPIFDDTNKSMGERNSEDSLRDASNYRMAVELMNLVGSTQRGDYTIEVYKNKNKCEVFALDENKEVIGVLDCSLESHPSLKIKEIPKVQSVYVYDEYQGKGIGITMYVFVIDIFGAIMSGYSLTGEEGRGSFQLWTKLGISYPYKYIVSNIASKNDIKIKQVHDFTRENMTNSREYFIVSKEKLV
jgi:GNAT superfamily N-acetyltransferase